jgi:hypothetical protein
MSRYLGASIETDVDGTFSFPVHEGLDYVARVSYSDPISPQQKPFLTSLGPFVASTDIQTLKVVLAAIR